MPENTTNLKLGLLQAGQDQKHVTVNKGLRILDTVCQLAVTNRTRTMPTNSPAEGDRFIVADGAGGSWTGWDRSVVAYQDGAWLRLVPVTGWQAFVAEEQSLVFWNGASWEALTAVTDLEAQVSAPNGSSTGLAVREELVTLLGASGSTTLSFPNRSIVTAVSVRVVDAITGATSYDCGFAGEVNKFGGSLGINSGDNNVGVIGPTAVYSDTSVVLTANGPNFTGGTVRVALHYLTAAGPTS